MTILRGESSNTGNNDLVLPCELSRQDASLNPIALRMVQTQLSFGHSEYNRVNDFPQ